MSSRGRRIRTLGPIRTSDSSPRFSGGVKPNADPVPKARLKRTPSLRPISTVPTGTEFVCCTHTRL